MSAGAPEKLWDPPAALVERSRLREYMGWLAAERGLDFGGYDELWRWSVSDLEGFWSSIWEFFEVQADGAPESVLANREMPGANGSPAPASTTPSTSSPERTTPRRRSCTPPSCVS